LKSWLASLTAELAPHQVDVAKPNKGGNMRLIRPALILAATVAFSTGALAQAKFGATGRWCGSSPAFKLSSVPKGTVKIDARMVDLHVPSFPHGGGRVDFQVGQKTIDCSAISQAALGGYQGPSPPPGQVHTYQWTIKALDAGRRVLGQAVTEMPFPQ
jgi:hypothetical protein